MSVMNALYEEHAADLVNEGRPFIGSVSRDAGVSPTQLRALLVGGKLRSVVRGVYADSAVPDTRALRTAAVSLVSPDGAAFFGTTAAFLFGVDAFPPKDR